MSCLTVGGPDDEQWLLLPRKTNCENSGGARILAHPEAFTLESTLAERFMHHQGGS